MAQFDWYQATVPDVSVDDFLAACFELDERVELAHAKGLHGYAHTTRVLGPDGELAKVFHGGSHPYLHAQFTSDSAPAGAQLLRCQFPAHLPSRIDACEDFGGEGTFDRFLPSLLSSADRYRVKVDTRGDHLLRKEARTVYLGAKTSAVQLRQYDKASELRSKFQADPARLATVPEHLTRVEAQVRPQTREARQTFATIEPMAVMGSAPWLRDVWQSIAGLGIEPVQVGKKWRQADDDRAYAYLLAQYGALLQRVQGDLGSWSAVGAQIGHDLAERAKAQRKVRRS